MRIMLHDITLHYIIRSQAPHAVAPRGPRGAVTILEFEPSPGPKWVDLNGQRSSNTKMSVLPV